MSTMSEQYRARAKEKVKRLIKGTSGAVDASGWKEPMGEKGDVQTGPRVLSRRQYQRGGLVAAGPQSAMRADRKPRAKGGGVVDDYFNVDMKKANELRDGEKHTGGLKSGGRAKKAKGGMTVSERSAENKPFTLDDIKNAHTENEGLIAKGYAPYPMADMYKRLRREDKEKLKRAAGGRAGKMMGGPARETGGRTWMPPSKPAQKIAESAMKMAQKKGVDPYNSAPSQGNAYSRLWKMSSSKPGRATGGLLKGGYKAGGKVHKDEAEDKKLIKAEMHKAGCSCAKCGGGKVSKASGGKTEGFGRYGSPVRDQYRNLRDSFMSDARKGPESEKAQNVESARRMNANVVRSLKSATGGKVAKKGGGDVADGAIQGTRPKGGRMARAEGGRTKKGAMNVNIIIAQPPGAGGMPPRPPMMPPPGALGMHQGAPPPAAAPAPMQPLTQGAPPMMRKSGGRIYPIKSGGGGGKARLEKIRAYG